MDLYSIKVDLKFKKLVVCGCLPASIQNSLNYCSYKQLQDNSAIIITIQAKFAVLHYILYTTIFYILDMYKSLNLEGGTKSLFSKSKLYQYIAKQQTSPSSALHIGNKLLAIIINCFSWQLNNLCFE